MLKLYLNDIVVATTNWCQNANCNNGIKKILKGMKMIY
jgi:hypothetical protein